MSATRGYSLALLSAVILSTTGIFIRHLTEAYHLPALVLAFWRAGFAATTLLVVLSLSRPDLLRVKAADFGYLAVYGLVLAGFNATWTLAVSLTGASLATVLVNGSAAFTAVLGWWFLREQLDWIKGFVVLLSFTGCLVVSRTAEPGSWNVHALGILMGITSALFYAAYSLMGRSASQRGLNPWTVVIYTFAFACAFLLIANLLPGGFLPGSARHVHTLFVLGREPSGWLWLLALSAGPTVIGFGLYNASMRHLPSSTANLIVTSEPVFTALVAYRLFGERLDSQQLLGSAMILGGVAFLRVAEGWRLRSIGKDLSPGREYEG